MGFGSNGLWNDEVPSYSSETWMKKIGRLRDGYEKKIKELEKKIKELKKIRG
jgi:hypothetical protein